MCGIAGFWASAPVADRSEVIAAMIAALHSRGPDAQGVWVNNDGCVSFGHRRLAIVDLSDAGHQPMVSASGRYSITFNGEIYNYQQIRTELEQTGAATVWRGNSDTEVLLAAIEHWGIEAALQRSVGMFALALWDLKARKLHLARDRFGEKPLYYGWSGNRFLFASELKAICAMRGFIRTIDRQALALFMRYLAVPAPRSIFKHIYKLEPGCLLTLTDAAAVPPPSMPPSAGTIYEAFSIKRWWSVAERFAVGAQDPFSDEGEALTMLEARLNESIALQSRADVPLGVFLSGGIDSSLIAALLQHQFNKRIPSFTVGFDYEKYDESVYARDVASHLGTDHHELRVTDAAAKAVIPALPTIYDEPFADSSQIPTYVISQAARQQVKVALSGDGGDELFGGYNRYLWGPKLWRTASLVPLALRQIAARGMGSLPPELWDRLLAGININHVGYKVHKLSNAIAASLTFEDFYRHLVGDWSMPNFVLGELDQPAHEINCAIGAMAGGDLAARMMLADSVFYLPNDILCKVDRAAMATSLETRAPFLDHRVAETAWRLPMSMRIRGRTGKWALRQILYRYVPEALVDRPKMGFGIPIGRWLRGPLLPWAEAMLDKHRISEEGYFDPEQVRKIWSIHRDGKRNLEQVLWPILVFQAWNEQWLGSKPIHPLENLCAH